MTTLRYLLLFLLLVGGESFTSPRQSKTFASPLALAADDHECTPEEVKAMDELIISLSMEPTDESRRARAVQIFEDNLSLPNGAPKRFADLFDAVLMVVGDRVQGEAKKRALEAGPQTTEEAEEEATNKDWMERSADERQLWALVDLMVQTKTLVKKASGNLGNSGTFT